MTIRFALLLAAAAMPAAALAAPTADLAAIDREVAGFTGVAQGRSGGAILPVDRRLRLAACASPLMLGWHTQRHESVLVQCPDPGSWRLFVPVLTSPMAAADAAVVARGEAVTVSVTGEGFAVSQPGVAMEGGGVGSWIRVRLVQGGTPKGDAMRAQVIRPGLVGVPLP